ncbi:MAG: alkaline phosphatase D family protein [Verrucomicrobia bacterium]|nr:alkaline phosphatase D family protein [Verrucomicrobiota bacterium]
MKALLFLALLATPLQAVGFADGVKIGEVTDTSAVLWVRLTERPEADRRIDQWDDQEPKQWSVPGAAGGLSIMLSHLGTVLAPEHPEVSKKTDFCHQFSLTDLKPDSEYLFAIHGVAIAGAKNTELETASITGSFRTAPAPAADQPVTFVVSTCQDFPRRDDLANGHKIYKSMLTLKPSFFVQTGDTLYYDKPNPFAKDLATARYKWNRIYALPNLREFHRQVPSYWLHDDHDVLMNDCWPGQTYGDLTWEQGLMVWREQIPQSDKPYRTFRWGKHVQVWFPEGREYRSPNNMKDGPDKSIFGAEQWKWIEQTMRDSDATNKFFVSATPVVGPDRKKKNDNHANGGFAIEGERLRKFLSSISGCVVINGDRHWQYHSIDPETGLQEFGSGPASDQHAGGWSQDRKLPPHQFLRVKGGFVSVKADGQGALLLHHDVNGVVVNTVTLRAPGK